MLLLLRRRRRRRHNIIRERRDRASSNPTAIDTRVPPLFRPSRLRRRTPPPSRRTEIGPTTKHVTRTVSWPTVTVLQASRVVPGKYILSRVENNGAVRALLQKRITVRTKRPFGTAVYEAGSKK